MVMAGLYKRGKRYWATYRLNGRQVQKSLGTTIERVARTRIRQIEFEIASGQLEQASNLPIVTVISAFCEHLQNRCPHKSYKGDVGRLRAFFGQICEELKLGPMGGVAGRVNSKPFPDKFAHAHVKVEFLEEVTPAMINRFISERLRHDKWSPKTANDMREILHRFFAYAIRHHGFCSRDRRYPNPVAAVERQREPAPQIRFLTLEQIDGQLDVLKRHPRLYALVATYIFAGLRREEALWLTREDMDLEKRIIRVQAKTIDGEKWQPKTRRNRAVPISEKLLGILREYEPPGTCVWFFPSPTGKRMDTDGFSQDLRKVNKANGLDWGCLDFRHTFGSQLAQKGESLYKIATLMGNSPAICQRHYAALIPETMHDTVEFPTAAPRPAVGDNGSDAATKELVDRILRELQARQGGSPQEPLPATT